MIPIQRRRVMRKTGSAGVSACSVLACALLLGVLSAALPAAYADGDVEQAAPVVRISRDFAQKNIDAIWACNVPNPDEHPIEAAIYDAVCREIEKAGYRVVKQGPSHVRLLVSVVHHEGPNLREFARRMGFNENVGPEEDYWLSVHVRITVMEQDVYSARCRMWHKFIPSEREHTEGWDQEVWPMDHYGAGPVTLKTAVAEISRLLVKDLPRRGN